MSVTLNDPVAFVGLGVMGREIAGHLLRAGQVLRGFDVSTGALTDFAAAGGIAYASPADAMRDARFAILLVHNEQQVEEVCFGVDGLASTATPGSIVWLASTVSPGYARHLARQLELLEVRLLDGPISGGVQRARDGSLSVFLGADPTTAEDAAELLGRVADRVFPAGGVGNGSALKLVNQTLTAANIALTAEAISLAERAGIPHDVLIDAVNHSAGASAQFALRAPRMSERDQTITATVGTFLKDLSIALDAADELGSPAPMTTAARDVFAEAGKRGLLSASDTRLIDVYEHGFDPGRTPSAARED